MSKKAEKQDTHENVSFIASETFRWKYDKLYWFTKGQAYSVPVGLYNQICRYVVIDNKKDKDIKEDGNKISQ